MTSIDAKSIETYIQDEKFNQIQKNIKDEHL